MDFGKASQSTIAGLVSHERAFVVYDIHTGEILHTHRAIEFPNALPPSESQEQRALRFAGANDASRSAVLEVPVETFDRSHPSRVDPSTKTIEWRTPDHSTRRSVRAAHSPQS